MSSNVIALHSLPRTTSRDRSGRGLSSGESRSRRRDQSQVELTDIVCEIMHSDDLDGIVCILESSSPFGHSSLRTLDILSEPLHTKMDRRGTGWFPIMTVTEHTTTSCTPSGKDHLNTKIEADLPGKKRCDCRCTGKTSDHVQCGLMVISH